MISFKHISKITVALIIAVLALCIAAMVFPDSLLSITNTSGYGMEYTDALFDTSEIIDINIIIDTDKWDEMLGSAIEEEYYECDTVINGEELYSVGIRTKGNTSLSAVANDPDNDRYSFKLEFDQFIEGQTCFGLDKLVLNNNYADVTNMKEAVIYDMFKYLDADASLYNYAKISVNGEYWGVYLALEAVEDSFMLRNFGNERVYLYKPENMNGGGKSGGSGSNLNYIDDELDSYSAIWDAEVNESTKSDHKRVVEALKNISGRNNVEKYADIEQLLKYMAVHNFSVNEDSLSGGMAHNYYLYEKGGQIGLIPWDYNLSFGGMNGGSADNVVNDPIDERYSSTELFDFILEDGEYLSRYHEYYNKLVNEYLYGGGFEECYRRIRSQIDELVENDPNAMYGYDEYTRAAELLYETVMLRAESVKGQLDGVIASTAQGQAENADGLVDASDIELSDMGQFMGGGGGGAHGGRGDFDKPDENAAPQGDMPNGEFNAPDSNAAPQGDMPNGEFNAPDSNAAPQGDMPNGEFNAPDSNAAPQGDMPDGEFNERDNNAPSQENMPNGEFNGRDNNAPSQENMPNGEFNRPDSNTAPQKNGGGRGGFNRTDGEGAMPDNAQEREKPTEMNENREQNGGEQDKHTPPDFKNGGNDGGREGFESRGDNSRQNTSSDNADTSISEHIKNNLTAYASMLLLAAAYVFVKLYKRKKY